MQDDNNNEINETTKKNNKSVSVVQQGKTKITYSSVYFKDLPFQDINSAIENKRFVKKNNNLHKLDKYMNNNLRIGKEFIHSADLAKKNANDKNQIEKSRTMNKKNNQNNNRKFNIDTQSSYIPKDELLRTDKVSKSNSTKTISLTKNLKTNTKKTKIKSKLFNIKNQVKNNNVNKSTNKHSLTPKNIYSRISSKKIKKENTISENKKTK